MIDSFTLLLSHGLMLIAAWRLLGRRELDDEGDGRPFPIKTRHEAARRRCVTFS